MAVATPRARTLVATRPLRKPVNPAAPTTPVIDETDNGDGTVTVRLALSDYVHASETSVVLSVAAGWRTGEAAATPTVTNNSTFVAAVPIFRWADVPYQRRTGTFDLELCVWSHHPNGTSPVAAVKFTVTDGTTVKTYWTTALGSSASFSDAVRVYRVTVDASVATALTTGLLRCDAEVYPWLGSMRSTDPAGTRSMSGLGTASFNTPAQSPFAVCWDPAGTRYGGMFAVLDPVNGTTTASSAQVQSTLALAKAVAAAAKPKDVVTAIQAGYLFNRTLPAANGQASQTRALDGMIVVIPAGVSQVGAGTVTFGANNPEAWLEVIGDPADANPRVNCILQGAATAGQARVLRARYANLSIEMDVAGVFNTSTVYHWVDNAEVRAKSGKEGTSGNVSASTGATIHYTRSRVWKTYRAMYYQSTHRPLLIRSCEGSRRMEALAILGSSWLGNAVDSFAPAAGTSSDNSATGGWNNQTVGAGDLGSQEDVIIAGNDLRNLTVRAWKPPLLAAATAGTPNNSYRRLVFADNLCERNGAGSSGEPLWSMGEDESATISYNIVEGNTFVGERCNMMYSDPLPATVAETNTLLNQAFGNRVANNSFDAAFTKHDDYADSQSQSLRGTNGYRPQMIEAWSVLYGVGWEGNYDFGRSVASGNFLWSYFGRRGVQVLAGNPGWPADRSRWGSRRRAAATTNQQPDRC